MIAHLNMLPQHVLHQLILRSHMEVSVVLLLSGISHTAHLSSWTSETSLSCFPVQFQVVVWKQEMLCWVFCGGFYRIPLCVFKGGS